MNAERSAKIDNYLLGEMSEAEIDLFEQAILADEDLFYDVAERENELVDRYVGGMLSQSAAERFRASLSQFPERQNKVANASLLKEYIAELQAAHSAETERVPWYRRLGFAFQAPAIASAALGLLLVGTIGFLFVQNRNLDRQLAHLDSKSHDLNQLRQREAELLAMLEAERSAGSDLTNDLESERERRSALETELVDLRKKIDTGEPVNNSPIVPTIATLILRPSGPRGGPGTVRNLRLDNAEKRVALKIFLPGESPEGPFSVRVNDIPAAISVRANKETGGSNSITVTVPSEAFRNGLNRVEVLDSTSKNVVSFAVVCERGPVR